MTRRTLALFGLALAGALAATRPALATEADLALYRRSIDWLAAQQQANGGFGQVPGEPPGELGITGLVVRALAAAPEPHRTRHAAAVRRACEFILGHQQPDGAFAHERSGLTTYRTSIAILALGAADRARYRDAIDRAVAWLRRDQFDEQENVTADDPHYGGFGYDQAGARPDADLSNTQIALQALHDAGIGPDDPVFQRVLTFLSRCQNSTETNPGVAGLRPLDDGGFIYDPGLSRNKSAMIENEDGTRSFVSYASMTYGGLLSLIHAGLSPDDARVRAARAWIAEHYTLEENYGLGIRAQDPQAGQQGLFYYYHAFAKCLAATGWPTIETAQGTRSWARDLFDALAARQKPEGFFMNENDRWWEQDPVLVTAYVVNAMNYALPFLEAERGTR